MTQKGRSSQKRTNDGGSGNAAKTLDVAASIAAGGGMIGDLVADLIGDDDSNDSGDNAFGDEEEEDGVGAEDEEDESVYGDPDTAMWK